MNLVLDIGNTFYKVYIFEDENIIFTNTLPEFSVGNLHELFDNYNIQQSIISSTRLPEPHLQQFLQNKLPLAIVFDPASTPVPISNAYDTPQTLGADRLAAAVEAANQFPNQELLIFDFGTALTIDRVSADNKYLGGNISPGLSTRFWALNKATKRLPLLEPSTEDYAPFGSSTNSAIIAGVMNSMTYEIEGYISKNRDKKIIFTGGEAYYFVKSSKNAIFADYQLVPKGLNRILNHNVQRK